ncbi:cyclic-di-AMP receptor [Sporolactobacillus terrae]|uniref:Uncharacterized protein n=1 Tax=Sporolactobacillus terrae TaxID=269673 RepID=A0A410D519_9BACL|nr:cyclic-di-AMP receptor [Sporolactobacillus terrae]QAA21199.1 hypothetical protein C0674_00250 [Sporolactobacillus terrae]QAA24172.1 hypothetical protein C0679_00230 [Sporolactobacillus terrae]UAK15982.1 cyclic-di-AMP receptor [Sporolactobacillus terrae]BBN97338.1 hypothetical protein St703_00430 [Sporolactobacillus terrae]
MKLIVAVVQDKDSANLQQALVAAKLHATKLASTGGFLRSGNTTFLIGTEDRRVDELLDLIKQHCHSRNQVISPISSLDANTDGYMMHPVEVEVGGATVFVLDVDQFKHF